MFSRRSAATSSYAAVSAAVVLLAVTADVDTVRKAELNDGGVWVTSGADHAFGRYIKAIGQLDAQIYPKAAAATDLDVLQDGSTVLAWDRSSATLYGVDAASRQLAGDGAVVPPATQVGLGGGTLAALDEKGALRASRLPGGTPDPALVTEAAPPVVEDIDGPTALAVGVDGSVAVATRDRVVVLRPDVAGFGEPQETRLPRVASGYQVTLVGGIAVALDPASGVLHVARGGEPRAVPTGLGKDARLQQPGPAADTVAVAGTTGLALVPLSGGAARRVSDVGDGAPAAPVRIGRCVFSAWTNGEYAKSCGGADAPTVDGFAPTSSTPVFRVNRGLVLLNDSATGAVYEVDDTVRAADQLWDRIEDDPDAPTEQIDTKPLEHQGDNKPPQPNPDTFGARPGRATVLHVLDNDSDPEGDLLVVAAVGVPDLPGVTALAAPDGQSIIVTLPEGLTGDVHFDYTVDDGYGGSASAGVTVQPRSSDQNTPPALRDGYEPPRLAVAPSGTLRVPVLPDWRDFDGDPMLVTGTTPAGAVVATSDGSLLITAPAQPGPFDVGYAVTDGLSEPVAAPPLAVDVLDPASPNPFAPPVARPDAVRVTVGQPAAVSPLANDLPGADGTDLQAHLSLGGPVAPVDGVDVSTDIGRGVLTVTANRPGSFRLAYTAAFGAAPTAIGEIRIDAVAAVGEALPPVAVPDSAVLRGQQPVLVDVLLNDHDPGGGLLVVQDATGDGRAGLSATVVDGRSLRIAATGSGVGTAGSVTYRVSNGRTEPATGSVAVTLLPASTENSAPFAFDDSVTVRAGDSAAISVLDNDFDPDGDPLSLLPAAIPVDPALKDVAASVNGRLVRVAAPASIIEPRQVTLQYVAVDPSGARSTGRVSVSIVPPSPAEQNQPPAPRDLEGRLVAGDTFVVRVPVYGIDPDGDSVTVTAVVLPPALGRIVAVGPDSISYQAYPGSGGTDRFVYEVVDPQGRTGQAEVRLGIVPPGAVAPPVAVDDPVSGVPGRSIHLDVTRNDLVPPGSRVSVLPLADLGPVPTGVRLDGNVVTVPVPDEKAPPTVVPYAISDGTGARSIANVVVRGDRTALLPPIAQDDTPPSDVSLDAPITIDVLRNDDDPDGSSADLEVSTFSDDVKVQGSKVVVAVGAQPRQVAYLVTDPDGLTAMAVVRVPGKTSPLPRVKPGARITVDVGGTVTVPLADIVEDPAGKAVRVTTTDHFYASPASGVALSATSETALTVTAAGSYAGPGAVSFQVTNGRTLQDAEARTVQLTVPVHVGPDAPALRCPSTPLEVVQGGVDVVAELLSLCHVWVDTTVESEPVRIDAAFTTPVDGLSAKIEDATRLVLTAGSAAQPGATGTLTLTVPGTPATSQLPVTVVAAPQPSVRALVLDGLQAEVATTVDLAQYVTSPLRDPRLSVVSVRQTSGSAVQSTVSGTSVTLTPGRDTKGSVTLSAVVSDVPDRPDRQVTLSMTATVQGRPGTPSQPAVVSVGSKQAVISWSASADNGAPIQRYEIGGAGSTTCQASPCTLTGLQNGTTYRFTVTAVNVVGTSDPSPESAPATPDAVPGAVSSIRLTPADQSMSAAWDVPSSEGTAVSSYQAEIKPAPASGGLQTVSGPGTSFSGLQNGVQYSVRVRARNAAEANQGFGEWSAYATETPFGTPPAMPAPSAKGADVPNPSKERAITVSWPAADGNGRDIASYTVVQYVDSSASGGFGTRVGEVSGAPSSFGGAGGHSTSFTVKNDGKFYKFTVSATNAGALTSPPSEKSTAVQGAAPPDQVPSVTAKDHADGSAAGYDGAVHVFFTTPASNAQTLSRVEYRVNGGSVRSWPLTASGQSVEQVAASGNGTPLTVDVRGCNDAGLCGPWSPPSNQVTPYGAPAPPNVNASQSGTRVDYSWGGGGNNGRAIDHYNVCISGRGCRDLGAGSDSVDYGYSATWQIDVYAVDAAGQRTSTVSRSGTTVAPPPPPPPSTWAVVANDNTCPQPDFNSNRYNAGPPATCSSPGGFIPRGTALTVTCRLPKSGWIYPYWYRIQSGWTAGYYVADGTVNGSVSGMPNC